MKVLTIILLGYWMNWKLANRRDTSKQVHRLNY